MKSSSPRKTFRSAVWPLVRFLGSLKLAMLLLTVLIIACVAGTLAESRFDAGVAQAYFYDAFWFNGWLLLLCTNLVCAVAVRYPWKPHQTGFIITHAGIVVIFIGALVGRLWGIEGNVTLHRGQGPVDFLVVNETVLEVRSPRTVESALIPVNLRTRLPSPHRPRTGGFGEYKVAVIGYTENLGIRSVLDQGGNGVPAVRLQLSSETAPRPMDRWMLLGDPARDTVRFGGSRIRFLAETDDENEIPEGVELVTAQVEVSESAPVSKASRTASEERHFLFARMPEMSMARVLSGGPSGMKLTYVFGDGGAGPGRLQIQAGENQFEFAVEEIAGKTVPLEGTDWEITGASYLPDFRLGDDGPMSASNEPRNPALVLDLRGFGSFAPAAAAQGGHDCEHEAAAACEHERACCESGASKAHAAGGHGHHHDHGHAGGHGLHGGQGGVVTIYMRPDGSLRYSTRLNGAELRGGPVEAGAGFMTGLADWKVVVQELVEKAVVREELAPLPPESKSMEGVPGLLVNIQNGSEAAREWIPTGRPHQVNIGDERLFFRFGYRIYPLDFSVVLDKFVVERNEGTQNPSSFKSYVRFIDSKGEKELAREIWMNNPASYPEFPGVSLLGTSYKFSQASWNPDDLNQTTLQVLRDPGWSFKWIGSLMLCVGLFTMFYLKPYPSRK